MKALTVLPLTAKSARVDEIDEPPIADGDVLVETIAVGICGTDLEIIAGDYGWSRRARSVSFLDMSRLGAWWRPLKEDP